MTLRAAVIGVGAMGRHHARVYAGLDGVDLAAVCDPAMAARDAVADEFGAGARFASHARMLERCDLDLVSVATPTVHHYGVARDCLKADLWVLVEKPLAATMREAYKLIALDHWARERGRGGLVVGHIERFNPAVAALRDAFVGGALGRTYFVSTRRCGPSPKRVRDVGVAVDLAAHDLDLMRWLLGGEDAAVVGAAVQHRGHGDLEDGAAGLLRFEGGVVGVLQVDWLTSAKVRDLMVVCEHGTLRADLLAKRAFASGEPDGGWRELTVAQGFEPLRLELRVFAALAAGAEEYGSDDLASAMDGAAALRLALDLQIHGRMT